MAIARKTGKPNLFLTMVANPHWPEIQAALLPGQTSVDRPDIVARVFKMKLEALLHDLYNDGVLGRVVGFIHVVEFQMRGLPHAHILVILDPADKPMTFTDYDKLVRAELPNKDEQPELYNIITTWHLHGPCGQINPHCPCMKDGVCKDRCVQNNIRGHCVVSMQSIL